jgi:outer membrane beta-barrel protein
MSRKAVWVLVIGMLLLSGNLGWGAEPQPQGEEKVFAVQNRIFHRNHEIDLSVGYIADDEFFMVYPVSLGYTFSFNENWSWEVARLQYFFNQDRSLKNELIEDFGADLEYFSEPKYMINTHLVFKPLYGKSAVMNRKVVNHETYFFVGPGVTQYEKEFSNGDSETENAFNVSAGVGFRYFLSQRYCLNFEIRDIASFRDENTENNLYFGIGLGWRFNLSPRKVEEDPTVKKLDKILSE